MRDELAKVIKQACKDLFKTDIDPELSRTDEQFGDYATSAALRLSKQLNKNPREVADQLTDHLKEQVKGMVKEMAIAGPGFINFTLADEELFDAALLAAETKLENYSDQPIVIETNNPNPFKDLHIGHAYNSIVADTIANLLEKGKAKVHRVSYHGDVGLHVGKSMWAILRYIDNDPSKLKHIKEIERPTFLAKMYAEGAVAYEQDDLAKQQIEAHAKQSFELADPVFEQVYETCKEWSFKYFDKAFASLGSQPTEKRYLEREADENGRKIVEEHVGPVFEKSQGAIIFPAERFGLHTRVFINSHGNTLYEARDLGLMQMKEDDFHPKSSYIVTANEQREYFKVVFKAAELAMPNLRSSTKNISTGTVKLTTGKMSSRTGDVVNIAWLFNELTRSVQTRTDDKKTVEDSVIGALRYTMLKHRIGSDMIFDTGEAISLEGNSGPYLQYAHARARSILKKSEGEKPKINDLEADERSMVRKISEYGDVVERAVIELLPHHITNYLHELAQQFNRFYEHNRVIGDARQDVRLAIVNAYADVLKDGLALLGIPAPEHM